MARFDKIPEGSRFRAEAAAALNDEAGTFGNGDLLCVTLDANGQLVVATATDISGIILTTEGVRDTHYVSAAAQKLVVGGKRYTVMRAGEILDCATFDTPLAAGDRVWADAAGAITTTGSAGDIFIGDVVPREEDSTQLRLVVNINGRPVSA